MSPDDYPNVKERRENLMRDDYRHQGTINVTAWDPGQRPTKEEDKPTQLIVFVLCLVFAVMGAGILVTVGQMTH